MGFNDYNKNIKDNIIVREKLDIEKANAKVSNKIEEVEIGNSSNYVVEVE